MRCSFCGFADSRVLDSRPAEDGNSIRRRRECAGCLRRFTTYERVDEIPLMVVKKDGRREPFEHKKLLSGLAKACQKRPVPMEKLTTAANHLERDLRNTTEAEINSRTIGEKVMELLRDLDEVAYVRFASVYREFCDVRGFLGEIEKLTGDGGGDKTD
ncbi:MAG: NrdR family transcriptional regulator [Peptococcaceae bacterium BRH_c4a]|nr:MAG: NrdR family transcriptional regulator [Peptococcaceae bacterium BRH_c4a]